MNHTPTLRADRRDAAHLENAAHEYGNTGDHDTYIRKVNAIRYLYISYERHPHLQQQIEEIHAPNGWAY